MCAESGRPVKTTARKNGHPVKMTTPARLQEGVEVFNRDAARDCGYGYTTNDQLSSRLATQRSTDVVLQTDQFGGRSVLDVGCGDGFYTVRYWDQGKPRRYTAVDAAGEAVRVARQRAADRSIDFSVVDGTQLPYRDDSFDVVLLQSILHHATDPAALIREGFRLAPSIVIHDPNGNNFGLKIIEKTSRYHIEHGEKSYSPQLLRRWVREASGAPVSEHFAGFVPMFCPDWMARVMKVLEGPLEAVPGLRALGCAVYTMVAERRGR